MCPRKSDPRHVSYSYDADGNQTGAGSRTFGYDLANRLASTASGGSTTSYSYDGSGNRLQATAGSQTTSYLWDEANSLPQLALERDGSGSLIRRYEYGSSRISLTTGAGQRYYFHADGLGSVANVTSASGQTEWTYGYEPYGAARVETKNDPAAPDNTMRFAGEQLDSDRGLYYLRARTYDPTSGRFLARDPLPQLATSPISSTYIYAVDSPTVYTDPSGLGPVRPPSHVFSPSPDLPWSNDCTPPRDLYAGPDLLWPAWAWGWRRACEGIKKMQAASAEGKNWSFDLNFSTPAVWLGNVHLWRSVGQQRTPSLYWVWTWLPILWFLDIFEYVR